MRAGRGHGPKASGQPGTKKLGQALLPTSLFEVCGGEGGETFEAGWRNKLIWGNNLLVMGSLLEKFVGEIDLVAIR